MNKNFRSKIKILIPKLSGNKYANLVTAFAVIVAVEYSPGIYDVWDGFIGLLAVVLGYSFVRDARMENDFWYSFITASIISLGIVSILSFLFPVITGYSVAEYKDKFISLRFLGFICLTVIIWFFCLRNKALNLQGIRTNE